MINYSSITWIKCRDNLQKQVEMLAAGHMGNFPDLLLALRRQHRTAQIIVIRPKNPLYLAQGRLD